MVRSAVRDLSAPLLVINLIFYFIVMGYASWNLNHFINGQAASPGVGANQATIYFLIFAILAGVVGVTATLPGLYHNCLWRVDTLPAAASFAAIAWVFTALTFGLACKEIHIGGQRGWRLRVLEASIVILAATQLLYVLLLHTGMFNSNYCPDYEDPYKEPTRDRPLERRRVMLHFITVMSVGPQPQDTTSLPCMNYESLNS
ncbi:AWPM-19-like family [Carex littledalei]|uniref:AWPM-19-like family n=1 Tax=Carex littledalei TaxID=544730 RepID=A0A833V3D5_9POAL|nr:AWPM-19-like family [Carex littledalei]